jgi:phage-related protein
MHIERVNIHLLSKAFRYIEGLFFSVELACKAVDYIIRLLSSLIKSVAAIICFLTHLISGVQPVISPVIRFFSDV